MENAAGKEIEETAELVEQSIKELRTLMSDEESFSCPEDDAFLLKFLRSRKYDVAATAESIKKYFRVRKEAPEIFDDFLPSSMLYDDICRKNKLAAVSRKRDASGRGVLLFRGGPWDSSVCTMIEFIKACLIFVEWLILDEDVQKQGIVFVLDNNGIGLEHMVHLTPFLMKKVLHITEKCFPVRVKAVYIINDSVVFDTLFAITRPFMSAKIVERVHLIGYELNKLLDVVPADVLPEEAGGSFESFDYDALEKDLLSKNDYFKEVSQYGYGKENTHI
uniref:CRAL-TRIO domain-containing protein n=1 Tax=Amblyomma maculatum TaxID=34609 RepID=G3MSF8_AMBMU